MSTSAERIAATQSRVKDVLDRTFPDAIDFGDGSFTISHGSTSVIVVVRPYTEHDTMVEITAHVATGATLTPELTKWLLRKNVELHFGGFGLLFDDTIVFSYSLPGSTLDAAGLEAAITAVAVVADHYDDEIVAMAGGKRVIDLEG
ncbi:MAG: YbjN domain-containing protein [Candidatus Kapabacteria bacterium]|nr:YbjN domain-containing protein [Candidatus Kapabacteria bacterium]